MEQRNQMSEPCSQVSNGSDFNYSSFHPVSQSSLFSPQQDTIIQSSSMLPSSSENTNSIFDKRPALPPKPSQGPPSYRDPPNPPVQEENSQHPDICINSKSSHSERKFQTTEVFAVERPESLGSRTQAWVQEHKSSGKLVGEKLSSIQRKLRSLLTQSTKETTDIERDISIEDKTVPDHHESWRNHSSNEFSRPKGSYRSSKVSLDPSEMQNQSYMSCIASSTNLSAGRPSHSHVCKTGFPERHPFGAPATMSEQEDSTDPDQLRDTCNKLFSRDQRISWTNYLSPRNCYSNNIKSSYDHDKLVPKEVIGRPCNDKKLESPVGDTSYDVTPLPSVSKLHGFHIKQSESQAAQGYDGSYFERKGESSTGRTELQDSIVSEHKLTTKGDVPPSSLPYGPTECVDSNDFYKSSSESGRGTMHSSMHGSKSVVSPHSSGVSAASNLDTSLDSDHSINETLWENQNHLDGKDFSKKYQVNQVKHIYETPKKGTTCRQIIDKHDDNEESSSESLSVTPPLPPLSPAPSPPADENSPKFSRTKYKLSLSASAINSSYNKPNDHLQKLSDASSSKSIPGKKCSVRRTASNNQSTGRQRSEKCTKESSGQHRLGILHNGYPDKKCPSPTRNSRNHIAMSSYLDPGDIDLTSTTTGLDMDSLLDEADDYSSDLSATASTMEPNEVNAIRKQLEGLETMYSEILRLLGVKNSSKDVVCGSTFDLPHHSRRRVNDSLSSLTARCAPSRGNHNFIDKRVFTEKRRLKNDCRLSSASKRLQRLESHVVTLARSVAHLSSEMRTQHVFVQELENMRQDVSWVQERMRLMQLAQGCHSSNGTGRNHQLAMPRDWDNFHREVLELLNPCRAKKLTKFFGDEPPLIRQFLKRLGYEKYAVNFEAEKIGIKELPYLTEDRLQKMGIPMGPRIRILQEAHTCCQQNQYKVYIV